MHYRPAHGHNLVVLEFIDSTHGTALVLLDAPISCRLIADLTTACDQADDQPPNVN